MNGGETPTEQKAMLEQSRIAADEDAASASKLRHSAVDMRLL